MIKKLLPPGILVLLLISTNLFAQQITSLTNYALNPNGHDIIRDIGATQEQTKITVGSYQPATNAPYDGFIWSDQTNDSYDWRVTVHGSGNDEINACDVRRFWNGSEYVADIYVTGYFTGTVTFTRTTWGFPYGYVVDFFTMNSPYGSNDCTYFVAKFNRAGGLVWIQYSGNTSQANTEIGNDVDVCEVGSEVQVYTTGFFRGNPYFYQGSTPITQVFSATSWNSAFTAKYVDNGSSATLSWVRTVNDNTNTQHDYGYGVCGDGAGNVYMCGSIGNTATIGSSTLSVEGNDDAMVVNYTAAGAVTWAQDIGGNGTLQTPSDQARCITFSDNKLYVSGYVCGYSSDFPQTNASSVDAFVMQMDASTAVFGWRNILQSLTGSDASYKHCISNDGDYLFVVGHMTGDLRLYCSSISSSGMVFSENGGAYASGFFVSFLRDNGDLADHEWVACFDNTCTMTTVEFLSADEVLFGGVFKDFWLFEENYMATNSNQTTLYNDGFLGTYDCNDIFNLAPPSSVEEEITTQSSTLELKAFPNPTNATVTISKRTNEAAQIDVLDLAGRTVIGPSLMNAVQTTIDLTTLDAGIYLVRVTEGNNSEIIRVTKQ